MEYKTRTAWQVRLPRIENAEQVLNDLTNQGWIIYKVSDPIQNGTGTFLNLTFFRTEVDEVPIGNS